MFKILRYFYTFIIIFILGLLLIISGCHDTDKMYEAQIAQSGAQVAIADSNAKIVESQETNATSRLYIQEMAKIATPNYMPLYIILSLISLTILTIGIYYLYCRFTLESQKLYLPINNYRVLDNPSRNKRSLPKKIKALVDNLDGYAEYNEYEQRWYIYDVDGELYKTYKQKQITMNNQH